MMPSAVVRLPRCMSLLLNCASDTLPYFRSGAVLRSWGRARRGTLGRLLLRVRVLRAVEAATALAVLDAGGVERPADDVVLHRRKVGDRAALDEDDGVLLKVVADAGDIGGDLHPVGQADTRDLSQRRVRLLRGHRPDDRADAALLRRATTQLGVATFERVPGRAQGRCIYLLLLRLPPAADELRDRWHVDSFCYVSPGHADAPKRTPDRSRFGLPSRPRSRPLRVRSSGAARPRSQHRERADARNDRPVTGGHRLERQPSVKFRGCLDGRATSGASDDLR